MVYLIPLQAKMLLIIVEINYRICNFYYYVKLFYLFFKAVNGISNLNFNIFFKDATLIAKNLVAEAV